MKAPEKYQFIITLGKTLHNYGVPSYKIQNYLEQISEQQGIKGSYMDLPTWVNFVFYDEDGQTYNYVERLVPGEWNLGGLSKAVEITNLFLSGSLSVEEATSRLKSLSKPASKKLLFLQALGFSFSAGSFSIILVVNWISALLATIMGLVVFLVTQIARKSSYVHSTLETLASFIVAIIVGGISAFYPNINITLIILSAIIPFIPGLAITTALEEITSRSLVSGAAKLFDAFTSLFKQLFGLVLAIVILHLTGKMQLQEVVDDIPSWVNTIAVIFLGSSLLPVFQVRGRDVIPGIIIGLIAYGVTILMNPYGVMVGAFTGTIAVVFISHIFSIINKTPKIVFLVLGTIMLVPGSKAFIGFSNLFIQTPGLSVNMFEQAAYIFMGIIGGLIFSGSFKVPVNKSSHH